MPPQVFIAHAKGDEAEAKKLAEPIRDAGYEVVYYGSIGVGDSLTDAANRVLALDGPVVLCGTINAIGTGAAHRVVNAANAAGRGVRVFPVRMHEGAYIEMLALDTKPAEYWRDGDAAVREVITALLRYYPLDATEAPVDLTTEDRYRELALASCDIVDLAGLPEDQSIAGLASELALRRLYVPLRVRPEPTVADFAELETRRLKRVDRTNEPGVSVGSRLAHARRLVILGDPGAGKTTLLRWLATAYLLRLKAAPEWKDLPDIETLPDRDWLPIIVRCRELDATALGGSLEDILRHTLRKAQLPEEQAGALRRLLMHRIGDGSALLLIDGLDEITDVPSRMKFCRDVEQIAIAFPQTPIVVTSRIVGYRELGLRIGRGFEHLTVADLTQEGKDDFVRRWCELTEHPDRRAKAAEELQRDIHATDRIEHLTGNPMLLTTMALVKRRVGQLPSRRVDLYKYAVDVLLAWRPEVEQRLEPREALPQLQYLAHAMCQRGVQQLREDEVLALLGRIREESPNLPAIHLRRPEEFLRVVERRTGLLVETGRVKHEAEEVPVFEFRHLTFQEYLAGIAVITGRYPGAKRGETFAERVGALATNVTEENEDWVITEAWREPIRLSVAAYEDSVDAAVLALMEVEQGEPATMVRPRAVLATACLADAPNVSKEVAEQVLERFASVIVSRDGFSDTSATLAARDMLVSPWREALTRVLAREFVSRAPAERSEVADLLLEVIETQCETVDEGQRLLHWETDEPATLVVSALASRELVRAGAVDPVETVDRIARLIPGGGALVHAAALSLEGSDVTPSMTQLLADTIGDPAVDWVAVEILADVLSVSHSRETVKALALRLEKSEDSHSRAEILRELHHFRQSAADVPSLFPYLQDTSEEVRSAAAGLAGVLRRLETVPQLIVLAQEERLPAAILALAEIRTPEATRAALEALRNDMADRMDAYTFTRSLVAIATEDAMELLRQRFLSSSSNEERRLIVYGLTQSIGHSYLVLASTVDYSQPITDAVIANVASEYGVPLEPVRAAFLTLAEYLPIELAFSS